MTKIETTTFKYENCGECPHIDYFGFDTICDLTEKKIPDMWGDIPEWCPLPNKENDKDNNYKKKIQ